jgi:hypothetical protein
MIAKVLPKVRITVPFNQKKKAASQRLNQFAKPIPRNKNVCAF